MKTILIVDDAYPLRESLGNAMEKRGLKTLKAATGVSAVKLYKEHSPDYVFLDIKLPDINGMNVFEQIREINPQAKIYFITGKDNQHFRDKADELKATGYFIKPVMLEDILRVTEGDT